MLYAEDYLLSREKILNDSLEFERVIADHHDLEAVLKINDENFVNRVMDKVLKPKEFSRIIANVYNFRYIASNFPKLYEFIIANPNEIQRLVRDKYSFYELVGARDRTIVGSLSFDHLKYRDELLNIFLQPPYHIFLRVIRNAADLQQLKMEYPDKIEKIDAVMSTTQEMRREVSLLRCVSRFFCVIQQKNEPLWSNLPKETLIKIIALSSGLAAQPIAEQIVTDQYKL